jgi:hypothetical protein
MSERDPIQEIDMQDPVNFGKAIELALASKDPDGWGETKTEWLHALAGDSPELWTVYSEKDHPDGPSVCAITGNGEKSKANAEFYASARKIVLGLVSEVDRLRTLLRTEPHPRDHAPEKE